MSARAPVLAACFAVLSCGCGATAASDAGRDVDAPDAPVAADALDVLALEDARSDVTARDTPGGDGGDPRCAVPPGAPAEIRAAVPAAGLTCVRYPFAMLRPRDVVETRAGEVLVTEMNRGQIVRLTGAGMVPVVTGLVAPIGLRELADGRFVVAEEDAHRVSRVDAATGAREVLATNLDNVTYLALAGDGRVYVSSFREFAPTGTLWRFAVAPGAVPEPFATGLDVPEGLLFEPSGALLVAEWNGASRVVRFGATGGAAASAEVVARGFDGVYGIVAHPRGGFLVADHARANTAQGRIVWVRSDGSTEDVLVGVQTPGGMTFTASGDLLVTEYEPRGNATGYLLRLSGF